MNVVTIDLWIVGIYFIAMIAVGIYFSRQINDSEDYAVAGRSLKLPVLAGTLIGTAIGAAATFGNAGKAFEVGYIILFSSFSYIIGYIIFSFLAPKLRTAEINSIPDALERRYGKSMRLIAAVILVITLIAVFGAQLIAFGITASAVFSEIGLNYENAILIGTLIIILYTIFGGLLAVAYTDMIQVIIMVIAIGILLPLGIAYNLPDDKSFIALLQSPQTDFWSGLDVGFLVALIPTYLAFVLIDPTIWQRVAAAKKASDLRPAMLLTAGVYFIWALVVVSLGVVAFNLMPELTSGDVAIPSLVISHLPPVVKGLCLAALMAIMMSTADTVLLLAGTTISGDIVKVLKTKLTDKSQLNINRSAIFIIGIIGAIFALQRSSIFEVMMLAFGIFVSGLFIPVMAALFWKKATNIAALSSGFAGVLTQLAIFTLKYIGVITIGVQPVLIALSASFLCMWLFGSLTYSKAETNLPLLASKSENTQHDIKDQ
jgi:SSS family transporter